MKDERKQVRAINQAIDRISATPMGRMKNSDLEILMLERIDDRLRELTRVILQQQHSQIKSTEIKEEVKRKKRGLFSLFS